MFIAVDFDGTIANTNLLKRNYALSVFGISMHPYLFNKTAFVKRHGLEKFNRMSRAIYTEEMTCATPPVAGAIRGLRRLAAGGHKLLMVSARSKPVLHWASIWLQARGVLHLFKETISSYETTKDTICRSLACDLLIDDDSHNLEAEETGYRKIMFAPMASEPDLLPAETYFANSWKEVLGIVDLLGEGGAP
jgi:hypothetical protein